jgi:dipeptidyl aminopeptidase/acylaminoacyl peptidase
MTPKTAPYGSWSSPITSELLVTDAVRLEYPTTDHDDVYWIESRPSEAGRNVIVKRNEDGTIEDVLDAGFAARTLAHEYGGRCHVVHDGVVYFSNFADQRLYRIDPGTPPRAITSEPKHPRAWRYADPIVSPDGDHLICVRERHEADVVINDLVVLATDGSSPARVLAEGHDFYAAPALSPDARQLSWITWDHPRMPWDGTELSEASLDEELNVLDARIVCGGLEESVVQPRYGADGSLYYISDRTGWWNLYRDAPEGAKALAVRDAEFAEPAWVFGLSSYTPLDDGSIALTWAEDGTGRLGVIAPDDGPLREVPTSFGSIGQVTALGGSIVALADSLTEPVAVVVINLTSGETSVVKASRVNSIDPSYLSIPQAVEFPTENGLSAHALYYPPTNRDFVAPEGTLPPLIVASHGGPTSQCSSGLNYSIQYWTSRGFAVTDVDYGGSTGYGRAYRERLKGAWGIVDLDDCVNAALYLASTGRADPNGLLIHGGSAGGYTTLSALTFRDVFAAGASYFGVGDLGALARDTHKFESRYLDGLIGPWPEAEATYEERSPIFHTDLLRTPVILFQGLEDEVVPPAQAEAMAEALSEKGVPFAYLAYEGEQHGFRIAKNIIRTAEAELYFYGKILGFEPAGSIEPVEIENLQTSTTIT